MDKKTRGFFSSFKLPISPPPFPLPLPSPPPPLPSSIHNSPTFATILKALYFLPRWTVKFWLDIWNVFSTVSVHIKIHVLVCRHAQYHIHESETQLPECTKHVTQYQHKTKHSTVQHSTATVQCSRRPTIQHGQSQKRRSPIFMTRVCSEMKIQSDMWCNLAPPHAVCSLDWNNRYHTSIQLYMHCNVG